VFAAGSVPTPPARERPGELEVPVTCGGLQVRPGDVVYGDADGGVVVPRERHDEIVVRLRTS
jgi:regulator of RNase E activity RraA